MKEPGLDGRHRDKDGEIDRKRSDTRVDTLRKTDGDDFLSDFRGDACLGTVLDEIGADSLTELVKEHRRVKDRAKSSRFALVRVSPHALFRFLQVFEFRHGFPNPIDRI